MRKEPSPMFFREKIAMKEPPSLFWKIPEVILSNAYPMELLKISKGIMQTKKITSGNRTPTNIKSLLNMESQDSPQESDSETMNRSIQLNHITNNNFIKI